MDLVNTEKQVLDVVIIGSGPAGYTAGIYSSRAQLRPVLFAGEKNGGQLMNTTLVENWPGSKEGVVGPDLMMEMRLQAEKFGTEIVDRDVARVDFSGEVKKIYVGRADDLSSQREYLAKTVIIASGAVSRMMGVPGENRLLGRGVATCAVCDAAFYKDKVTFVVGGGDAAVEDAMALTKFARKVTMLVRKEDLKASRIMADRAKTNEKIEFMFNTEVKEVRGEQKVERVVVVNNQTKAEQELDADGIFVAIGHIPMTDIFKGQVGLDEKGYLVTGMTYSSNLESSSFVTATSDIPPNRLSSDSVSSAGKQIPNSKSSSLWLEGYPTMTSVAGVFGAGDVVDFRYRQAITSAGMGCMAALDVERYLTGSIGSY